jgi:hypothetical protein
MKKKQHAIIHKPTSLSDAFCKYHPSTFMEPRFADDRVFWECPDCEREFYYERKIAEFEWSTNE